MTDKTDWLEAAILDWAFAGTDMPAAPATIYVALHTGDPGDDGTANEIGTSGTGYARQPLDTPGDWSRPSHNEAANAALVTFGPAESDWGDVSHISLWDSQTGGNPLYAGDLDTTRTILTGDRYELDPDDIPVTED